jgi:cell division protein FtsB
VADRPDKRRPPTRGRSRPRTGGAGRGASGSATPGTGPAPATPRRRPRLTGRSAVLVLVLAVLAVSYASSMRAYLEQRAHIGDLKAEISEREAAIDDLSLERQRWDDPAYAEQQARERFGYVMPGETSYVVLDEDGEPLEPEATLSGDTPADPTDEQAWWDRAWSSVETAGDPPRTEEAPAVRVDGTQR